MEPELRASASASEAEEEGGVSKKEVGAPHLSPPTFHLPREHGERGGGGASRGVIGDGRGVVGS